MELVVIGVVCLLVHFVMRMTLFVGTMSVSSKNYVKLRICSSYAISHGLEFNASKTQLMCFHTPPIRPYAASIVFDGVQLKYSDVITHLGHILTSNLNDTEDIVRAIKDMNRKANTVLYSFRSADPFVKSYLIKSYCLSLYGCVLWSMSTQSLKLIEISLNKILRKVWNLPFNSHTAIVHCVAQIHTICNLLYKHFCSFHSLAMSSTSPLIRSVFTESSYSVYSSIGYNYTYGHQHIRIYDDEDFLHAMSIRRIRAFYGTL